MGNHPLNLGLRFLLELASYLALAFWGHTLLPGVLGWLSALGVPLAAALLWATFAVPNDPSRSGRAPVPVPGWVRLLLEIAFFAAGVAALYALARPGLGASLAGLTIVHHIASYDRIGWLLGRSPRPG